MKTITKIVVLATSLVVVSGSTYAERTEDGGLVGQYRDIQNHSQLFNLLQHYYFQSGETARAMQSTMSARQLEVINQQLQLMNQHLTILIALEKQRSTLKKG